MAKLIKGIIFDFDGVLVDSENFYFSFWTEFFRERNLDCSTASLGFNLEEYLQIIGMVNFSEEIRHARNIEERIFFNTALINQYFKAFILERKNELKFMIGSNNSSQIISEFLARNKIEEFFLDVITPDCGYRPKPNSDIYKECLKRMELPKEAVLVIEDSQTGILAAGLAGLKSLFIPFPKFEKDIKVLNDYFD